LSRARRLERAHAVQGQQAGVVSRLLAAAVDLLTVVLIGYALVLVGAGIRSLFTGRVQVVAPAEPWRYLLTALLLLAYLAYGWGLNGRTTGKILLGLRVVGDGGGDLSFARGLARAAVYLLFLPGILWVAVSRRNASVQDLLLRTAVVYDWGLPAHAPSPARQGVAPRR